MLNVRNTGHLWINMTGQKLGNLMVTNNIITKAYVLSCLSSKMDVLSSRWGGQNNAQILGLPQEKV